MSISLFTKCAWFALGVWATTASGWSAAVTAVTSFTVAWGHAPECLGLQAAVETERVGPLTFAVAPSGEIYVADTVHQAIKVWLGDGTFGGVFLEHKRPTSMTCDHEGRLLLLEGRTVEIWQRGKTSPSATVQLPQNLPLVEGYGQDLMVEGERICVNDPEENVYCFSLAEREPTTASRVALGRAARSDTRVWVRRDHRGVRAYEWSPHATQPGADAGAVTRSAVRTFDFAPARRDSSQAMGGVIFRGLGLSPPRYLFETEEIAGGRVSLVVRGDPDTGAPGQSARYELPNNYWTTVYRKIVVHGDDRVWQMLTRPEGVAFVQWRLEP